MKYSGPTRVSVYPSVTLPRPLHTAQWVSECGVQPGGWPKPGVSLAPSVFVYPGWLLAWRLHSPGTLTTARESCGCCMVPHGYQGCAEPDENVRYWFSKNRTEPNRPQNSKIENSVSAVRFSKNRLQHFGDGFSRCLIHTSFCSMIG